MLRAEQAHLKLMQPSQHPFRLHVVALGQERLRQIALRCTPFVALRCLTRDPQPPRLRQPRPHSPRELLLARLALPPYLVSSVRLLRDRRFDEAADVRQPAVAAARAAGLDRRRARVVAYDARSVIGRHFFPKQERSALARQRPVWFFPKQERSALARQRPVAAVWSSASLDVVL
jgi:hypothetical protein